MILCFTAFACESTIDIELPEEPSKLVLNEVVNTDSVVVVEISKSQSIQETQSELRVTGAAVTLYENNNLVGTLQEDPTLYGSYRSDLIPTAGNNYTVRVEKEGFESISGTTFLHFPTPINQIKSSLRSLTSDDYRRFEVTIADPQQDLNFYALDVFVLDYYLGPAGDTLTYEQWIPISFVYDPVLQGATNDFSSYNFGIPFDDTYFNGESYTLIFDIQVYLEDDGTELIGYDNTYYIRLNTTDEDFFRYNRSISAYDQANGNPFAEPVQVYSNIENGFGLLGSSAKYVQGYPIQ